MIINESEDRELDKKYDQGRYSADELLNQHHVDDSHADINIDEEKNQKSSNKKSSKFYSDDLIHSELKIELKKSSSRLYSK